ncbi:condensation domain-containing protein [Streptomyces sp. NPDC057616]|uniref:condensation domain-containing protein n=1 Tax=Streptomyces sp. NPDC057616 TaxID=3346183 RepID=UPI0036A19CAC
MDDGRPAGVCAVIDPEHGAHGALHLHGPLPAGRFQRALHRIAEIRPQARHPLPRLLRHGPDLHTVELPGPDGGSAPYPAGLLADLLTAPPGRHEPDQERAPGPEPGPDEEERGRGAGAAGGGPGPPCGTLPRTHPPTPLQLQRLAEALASPGRQVEQLLWRWHGPLDVARLTAAWQAVGDHESVLRTAFLWEPRPRAVVFDRAVVEVARRQAGGLLARAGLLASERARAFDLRRPMPLRVTLLEGGAGRAAAPFTDVLVTYHRALLDSWSVRLLMRECCRAYLAGGVLPGGERRPDLSDCARHLAARDLGPAGDFWRRPHAHLPHPSSAPPAPPAASAVSAVDGPAAAAGGDGAAGGGSAGGGGGAGGGGTGVHRAGLSAAESARLARWAAQWGVTESSVLQAVWAMLLYRARGAPPAGAVVGFGLSFAGRGLLLEGIGAIPGPFENALPVTVAVDAGLRLPRLLHHLRDRVVDMAAYEWVPAAGMGAPPGAAVGAGGLLAVDCGPRPEDSHGAALAAHGIRLQEQEAAAAPAGYALRLSAGHDSARALVLTCVHDRDLVAAATARTLLAQAVGLLRLLPSTAGEASTVADVLARLPPAPTPRLPAAGCGPAATAPVLLRAAAAPGAATVCLIDVPGAPRTGHGELVRHYRGPEALTAWRAAGVADGAPAAALARLARAPGRLVLGGYSGAGALACELARHAARHATRPPLVVIGGSTDDADGARTLARALRRAGAPPARP